jgi:hypothetical protein
MKMPLMWMEARCEGEAARNVLGIARCHETGPGMFARRASTAVKNTEAAGWRIVDGKWYCPVCLVRE